MPRNETGKPQGYFKEARVKGASMTEWAASLKEVNKKLSQDLDVPRDEAFEAVDRIKLPRYERFSAQLSDFVKNSEKFFGIIKSAYCYFNLKPLKPGLKNYREPGVTKDQVTQFIMSGINKDQYKDYNLTVSEYYENEFGGNILVNKDSGVQIEFKKGSQGPISHGSVVPEYTVEADPFTKVFKYSFDDEALRKIIQSTLVKIPYDEQNGYLQGYYEFQLVRKNKNKALEPIFIDYKTDQAYFFGKGTKQSIPRKR